MQQRPPGFSDIQKAVFVRRPNRFLAECLLNNSMVLAHLPNPGRMWELLLPDAILHLVKNERADLQKTAYTVVAVDREGVPVMLHTQHTNNLARWLITNKKICGLEEYEVERDEVTFGSSRFDFLLRGNDHRLVLEVKSCTLFSKGVAMFPDAVTARGRKHLRELAALSTNKMRAGVL
ncbi:MAG: DNA/RNA nuclease SfsA, partial [Pseudomonadota bacterium]